MMYRAGNFNNIATSIFRIQMEPGVWLLVENGSVFLVFRTAKKPGAL
jgi:hypothetical protein